jgi:DNA-directed RNA polymerase specialized sigma24 family protein
MQHGDDAMVQRIERIATERRSLDRELERIGAQENRLNNLLRAIGELDTFEKHVVVGQYIDGRSSKELGEMIRKSEDSIALYRKQAVRKLTRILYLIVDNTVGLKEDLR